MISSRRGIAGCFFLAIVALWLATDRGSDGDDDEASKRQQNEAASSLSPNDVVARGSSVFCQGDSARTRSCRFKNLCYWPSNDEFLFFHGPETAIDGLPTQRFDPAFLDLSSVSDHNTQHFEYTDLPASTLRPRPRTKEKEFEESFRVGAYERGRHVVFNRFNPGNFMHVLHDDLLPIYFTLRQNQLIDCLTTGCKYRLVAVDRHNDDDGSAYIDLYRLLVPFDDGILTRKDLIQLGGGGGGGGGDAGSNLVCFEDAIVGLSKLSTWYQYGFHEPQGAIPDTHATGNLLRQFVAFFKERLGVVESTASSNRYLFPKDNIKPGSIVLLSRSMNRIILNENELSASVSTKMETSVNVLSVETTSLRDQIVAVANASILIGMHGSSLALALFLGEGSALVELFPYAVPASEYQPYKTLTGLPGMNVAYQSWENECEENTITHPDYPSAYGGLGHLSDVERDEIMTSRRVRRHLCCENPEWLYRIYQDTFVDISSVLTVVKRAWQGAIHIQDNLKAIDRTVTSVGPWQKIFPSKLRNVTCVVVRSKDDGGGIGLRLTWMPSWNRAYIAGEVWYEVWIQEEGKESYDAYKLQATEYTFFDNIRRGTSYIVWVRSVIGNLEGPFSGSLQCRT